MLDEWICLSCFTVGNICPVRQCLSGQLLSHKQFNILRFQTPMNVFILILNKMHDQHKQMLVFKLVKFSWRHSFYFSQTHGKLVKSNNKFMITKNTKKMKPTDLTGLPSFKEDSHEGLNWITWRTKIIIFDFLPKCVKSEDPRLL